MAVVKGVLSMDKAVRGETVWLRCGWDDCERQGVDLHKTRFHDHPPRMRCDSIDAKHVFYVFCSDGHKNLFLNSHRNMGNRTPGTNPRLM